MLVEESEIIREILQDTHNKDILNLGSGTFQHYQIDCSHIWYNIHLPLLERENILKNVDLKDDIGIHIVADMSDMPIIPDMSQDVILFNNCIEHLESPILQGALNEIHRILKEDGFMIASGPGMFPVHKQPIDNYHRFPDRSTWNHLFEYYEDDFKVTKFWRTENTPYPCKNVTTGKDMTTPVFSTIVKAVPV